MANSYLPVQDVTADYKLETATFNVDGTNVVHRERVMLAGNTASSIWDIVNAAPPSNSYGPVVRMIGMYTAAGDLMVNDTLDSLQVSIMSSVPGTASINSGKAIDSAAGATDTGFAVLVIRDDALSTLTPAEGDYAPLRVNSTGALHVTGGGGGTQFAEDAAHTTGDTGTLSLAIRSDTFGTAGNIAGTTGDYIGLQTDSGGALWTNVIAVVPGTGATSLGKAADAVAGATDTGIAPLAIRDDSLSALTPAEGDYVPLRVSSTGALHVTGGGGGTQFAEDAAHASSDVGTFALAVRADTLGAAGGIAGTTGDYIGLQTDAFGAQWTRDTFKTSAGVDMTDTTNNCLKVSGVTVQAISGNVAHDAADTPQNPLLTGAYAIAHGATPTAVTAADITRLYANREGLPWVMGGAPNIISHEVTYTVKPTDDTAVVTVSAGSKIAVTQAYVISSNDMAVDVTFRMGFATVNLPTASTNAISGMVLSHPKIGPGSGFSRGAGSGLLAVGGDGEDLRLQTGTITTGTLRVGYSYYLTAS